MAGRCLDAWRLVPPRTTPFNSGFPAHALGTGYRRQPGPVPSPSTLAAPPRLYALEIACRKSLQGRRRSISVSSARSNAADNLILHIGFSKRFKALSPTGRSRPFIKGPDTGLVPAEGAVAVVLKRPQGDRDARDKSTGVIARSAFPIDAVARPPRPRQRRPGRSHAAAPMPKLGLILTVSISIECHATAPPWATVSEIAAAPSVFGHRASFFPLAAQANTGHLNHRSRPRQASLKLTQAMAPPRRCRPCRSTAT